MDDDTIGWYEFQMPGGPTTHIAYVHESGWVYLPEGEGVVTEQDFHLASATDQFWRLGRIAVLEAELQTTKDALMRVAALFDLQFGSGPPDRRHYVDVGAFHAHTWWYKLLSDPIASYRSGVTPDKEGNTK